MALVEKNPPANAGDAGSIPGLGRSTGGGHENLLWYSCPENAMDRGTWQATVHVGTKSQTQLCNWTHTATKWAKPQLKHKYAGCKSVLKVACEDRRSGMNKVMVSDPGRPLRQRQWASFVRWCWKTHIYTYYLKQCMGHSKWDINYLGYLLLLLCRGLKMKGAQSWSPW